jgi:hypothetical protein
MFFAFSVLIGVAVHIEFKRHGLELKQRTRTLVNSHYHLL